MQVFQERPHRNLTEIMKLRIKFKKYGPVRFIGHLDVMRFFQKANRRAELDVAYTGGFSPHQIMSFAAPLGVGLTSNGEYMDLEVHSLTSCEDVKTRLNAASVPGIEITSVKILPDKAGNAMASVAAAGYTVTLQGGSGFTPFTTTTNSTFLCVVDWIFHRTAIKPNTSITSQI